MACEDDMVLGVTWIDIGPVQILSKVHHMGRLHTVERARKRSRLTSTNGPHVRDVSAEFATITLPIPKIIEDYNFLIGGVDIADKLRSVHTSRMVSQRTWMSLLFLFSVHCSF